MGQVLGAGAHPHCGRSQSPPKNNRPACAGRFRMAVLRWNQLTLTALQAAATALVE
jgi:hypothetical protein